MAAVVLYAAFYPTLAQISFVYSEHLALPPRSPVRYLASLITAKQAAWILSACALSFKCRSIITADNNSAVGLAKSMPAISGAVPWTFCNENKQVYSQSQYNIIYVTLTDSNRAPFKPMFPDGVRPSPPTSPAHISDKMSPYKFGITWGIVY